MGMWKYRIAIIPDPGRADSYSSIRLLTDQVERARRVIAARPLISQDVAAWNAGTTACLVAVYGRNSPNPFSVDFYPGADAAWVDNLGEIFGGNREVAESYLVSTIEERVRLLKECIVTLSNTSAASPITS